MKSRQSGSRTQWFFFFFARSVSQRKGRVVIASLSVMLAVGVVTAMIGITSGIKEKLGTELKAYGANIIVSPARGKYFPFESLDTIKQIDYVEDAAGQVFGSMSFGDHEIEIIGLDINSLKNKGWRLFGKWPEKDGDIVAGVNLRDMLNLTEGEKVQQRIAPGLSGNTPSQSASDKGETGVGRRREFIITGFIEKGGTEDSAFIMSIPDAWEITGNRGRLNAVLVNGRSGELDVAVAKIRRSFPEAEVKTFRQIAFAEEALLFKIQLLMTLVTAVVLLATAISVASTMGANVLERREEIGLMKAIGATRKSIRSFYLAEAALIGIAGGISGFLLGFLAAELISKGAFDSFVAISLYLPFLSLLIGLVVSVSAGYFPVRDAMKYEPAVILRGE